MREVARLARIGHGTLENILRKRVKNISGVVRDKITDALIAALQRQIEGLTNELSIVQCARRADPLPASDAPAIHRISLAQRWGRPAMAEPTYSLRKDAAEFFARFVDRHAGAPSALTALAKTALRLGDLSDDQLAKHRTALRGLRKLIDLAIRIGEGHADDRRKVWLASREQEEAAPPASAEAGHG
jgi:hypothetical protein